MKRVLIVEDEALHLTTIKSAFEGSEQEFDLQTAGTLNQAIEILRKEKPDVILTDNRLPDGEGKQMLKQVAGDCPIVLMSAYGDEALAVEALKEGAQDYVVKAPEGIEALPVTIRQALKEWQLRQQQQRLQQELASREKMYRSLFEESHEAIFIYDGHGQIRDVNRRATRLLGYSRSQMLGRYVHGLHPENLPRQADQWLEVFSRKGSHRFEGVLLTRSGSTLHVEIRARVLDWKNQLIQGIVREINARLRAEQATQRSEIFMREVINNMGQGLAVYDRQLRYQEWNPFMEKLTGKSAQEVLGHYAFNVFPFLKRYGIDQLMQRALNGEQIRTPDIPFEVHQSGYSGWSSSLYSPHYDEKGNIIGVIALVQDVTQRKSFEQKLEQWNTLKDQLFSIIGHDLRNPISEVFGFSELLMRNHQNYSSQKLELFYEQIYEATKRVYDLLENLLEWSKIRGDYDHFRPVPFHLSRVVDDSIGLYHIKAWKQQMDVRNNIPHDLRVEGDQRMIRTVLRNLISNALKYTPQKGRISIDARLAEGKMVISVSDNGRGMNKAQQEVLFNGKVNESTKGYSAEAGAGMGLLLSKELMEQHGEELRVQSQPGKGSVFYFTLPPAGDNKDL